MNPLLLWAGGYALTLISLFGLAYLLFRVLKEFHLTYNTSRASPLATDFDSDNFYSWDIITFAPHMDYRSFLSLPPVTRPSCDAHFNTNHLCSPAL